MKLKELKHKESRAALDPRKRDEERRWYQERPGERYHVDSTRRVRYTPFIVYAITIFLVGSLQFGNSFMHYRITVNIYGIQFTIQVVTVQHHIIINSEKIDMKKGGLSVMIPGTHAMHLLQNRLHTILIHLYILTNYIDPNIKGILNPLM